MLHSPDHVASASSCTCPCSDCELRGDHAVVAHELGPVAAATAERDPLTRALADELAPPVGAYAELLEGHATFDPPAIVDDALSSPRAQLAALRAGIRAARGSER